MLRTEVPGSQLNSTMSDAGIKMKRLINRQLLAGDEGWSGGDVRIAVEASLKRWRRCPADRENVILVPGENKVEA